MNEDKEIEAPYRDYPKFPVEVAHKYVREHIGLSYRAHKETKVTINGTKHVIYSIKTKINGETKTPFTFSVNADTLEVTNKPNEEFIEAIKYKKRGAVNMNRVSKVFCPNCGGEFSKSEWKVVECYNTLINKDSMVGIQCPYCGYIKSTKNEDYEENE